MDLNSLIADHETVEAAPVEAAPAAAEPAAPEPAAPAADVTPAADPFADLGIDPAELQELAQYAPMLRQIRDQAYAADPGVEQPQPQGPPQFDPFDPESMQQYMAWERSQTIEALRAELAPLVGHQQEQILGEAENRAMDILKDDAARNGDFVGGDTSLTLARNMAEQLLPQFEERYGFGAKAAEAALAASAAQVRQMEQQIGQAAVDRYKNELAGLAGARTEPGAATVASEGPGEYKTEMEALAAWQARNNLAA